MCDILKINNMLNKSLCYVTEYNICNLVVLTQP